MPDAKISADPAITDFADADSVPIVQSAANKRFTWALLKEKLASVLATTAAVSDHPGYVAGRYYVPAGVGPMVGGLTLSATSTYLFYGIVKQRVTLSQLGARLTTAAAGNVQYAIYTADPVTKMAKTLIGATVSGSTNGAAGPINNAFTGANPTLDPGGYWFALQCDNTTAVFTSQAGSHMFHASTIGSTVSVLSGNANAPVSYTYTGSVFGTWPADISAAGFTMVEQNSTRSPIIQFLVASVP